MIHRLSITYLLENVVSVQRQKKPSALQHNISNY